MKTNSKFALSAAMGLGLAAMAVPAMAADVVYQEPPAPQPIMESAPISSWAGPYGGVQLGYGFSGSADDGVNDIETDGFMGGAFGGFNMQNGQFVYGVEGDVNYSGLEGDNAGFEARSRVDGSVRGRAGVAVTNDILVYGTAGVAAESLRITDQVSGARDSNTMLGYTVGAGTDVKLTEDVFARAEYRYTDYGSETFDLPGVGTAEVDSSNHRVMMGVGVKF
ncbi:outer membrane protein [Mesorhizobium sp. CAU 1741]|uniref:outer membrane protein n=1 Tax=Mesorhizobium sp. CAU 1741 TaxID=3140366 RepID=UPI00325B175E